LLKALLWVQFVFFNECLLILGLWSPVSSSPFCWKCWILLTIIATIGIRVLAVVVIAITTSWAVSIIGVVTIMVSVPVTFLGTISVAALVMVTVVMVTIAIVFDVGSEGGH
jgi:hypothetical protein